MSQSVVLKSGQLWKLLLAAFGLLFGSFAPMSPEIGVSWTSGTVIAVAAYGFALFAIRCESCGKMWFWEAAKDPVFYGPIFKGSACPCCGHKFNEQ